MKELDELQEIARIATRKALEDYEFPETWQDSLVLGVFFEDNARIFELYIPRERPEEAIVISSARVNCQTKAVSVTISNLEKKIN
ncbi:hypothetical protein Lepto7376_2317 [[Leptolyngbya] sp. PCC 7376]|uniref:hypothetical protein n=1 Tax=[Leptolyngbya] sp. PCC 7376 TaxID=111781 RepID=UPI00029EE605|nr:hypothetical protein [[Leptolyngbya] sp. PCC 7376]AFY38604.1 hypothetical protein Lepto7376_2317 [[Leptolyngbya] sp. PCC 7376]